MLLERAVCAQGMCCATTDRVSNRARLQLLASCVFHMIRSDELVPSLAMLLWSNVTASPRTLLSPDRKKS